MLVPTGQDVALPVTVVVVGDRPEVRSGLLRRVDADGVRVWLPEPLADGARVVVAVGARTTVSGRVLGRAGEVHTISRDAARTPDDRSAPRVTGPAVVRWRVRGDVGAAAWLSGSSDGGPLFVWSGDVEVSLSGMAFAVADPLPVGARLQLEVTLEDKPPWRALGVVRRCAGTVAVEFLRLSDDALDTVSDFTLERAAD